MFLKFKTYPAERERERKRNDGKRILKMMKTAANVGKVWKSNFELCNR